MKKIMVIVLVLIGVVSLGQDVLKTSKVRFKCTLEEKPLPGTGSIQIKKGESVDIIDYKDGYFKVNYNDNLGYISDLFIYEPELLKIAKQKADIEIVENEKYAKEHQVAHKQFLIEQYGESRTALILKKLVCIGMTREEAIESWGKPTDINKTTSSYGIHEQWIYDKGKYFKSKYLYFEDGILRTIQE